jgi:hypothetical protein
MGAVGEAGGVGDGSHGLAGVAQQPVGMAQAQAVIGEAGALAEPGAEQAFELARGKAEMAGERADGQGRGQVLFHQGKGAAQAWFFGQVFPGRAGLGGVGVGGAGEEGAVEQQDVAGLAGGGVAEMAFDEMGGEVAGAGDAAVLDEEEAVGDGFAGGEGLAEILVVEPADAAAAGGEVSGCR